MTLAAAWCSIMHGLGPAQRADHAGQHDREAVAAGVDDAGLAQHRKQVGTALDRLLAGVERALHHLGGQRVLLLVAGVRAEPRLRHVRELGGDLASAISRTTVRIVPSAGSRTEP